MRLAYEIGYSTAMLFSGRILRFLSLDNTTFRLPVSVGSILRLTSVVAHTVSLPLDEGNEYSDLVVTSLFCDCTGASSSPLTSPIVRFFIFQNVCVQANVLNVETGEEEKTNEFHFTWGVEGSKPLQKSVVPVTYTGSSTLLPFNKLLATTVPHRKVLTNLLFVQRRCSGSKRDAS